MIVNSDFLGALYQGLRAIYLETFDSTLTVSDKISTVVSSDTYSEAYNWLGAIPKMQEWRDELIPGGLMSHDYTIVNKKWGVAIEVDIDTLEDNKLKLIEPRIREMAQEVKRHIDELVFSLLANGFTNLCYDKKPFFSDEHEEGKSGVQSNIVRGQLNSAKLKEAISRMRQFKNDQGKPIGLIADTIITGVGDVYWTARELLASPTRIIAGTTDREIPGLNIFSQGILQYHISSEYLPPEFWCVMCTNRSVKALITQIRQQAEFKEIRDEKRDKIIYLAKARYNAGYGLWQCAVAGLV